MVRNIASGGTGSYPYEAVVIGKTILFPATDDHGTELWRSDGTRAGTRRVADLRPGHASSDSADSFGSAGPWCSLRMTASMAWSPGSTRHSLGPSAADGASAAQPLDAHECAARRAAAYRAGVTKPIPTVTLVPMSPAAWDAWRAASIREYAAAKVRAGTWTADAAPGRAEREFAELLPQGLATPAQELRSIVATDGTDVGAVWLGPRDMPGKGTGFIWDIEVRAEFRGQGYGRAALLALEPLARELLGYDAIGLHVFSDNTVARELYRTSGYMETDVTMVKTPDLSHRGIVAAPRRRGGGYWRAIATRIRSSGVMRWSWSSAASPISSSTHWTRP